MKELKRQERHRTESGYTLIELLVVIVIIGMLMAIAIPVIKALQANGSGASAGAIVLLLVGLATAVSVVGGTVYAIVKFKAKTNVSLEKEL